MILMSALLIPQAQAKTALVLSTDVGNEIDDQWAIAYMMTNPDFEVRGIVSAHAPSLPDPSGYQTYLLLKDEIENHLGLHVHPPLLQGSDVALTNRHTPQMNDAVRFMIEESKHFNSDDRLTIVAIGATTDVASAILADPLMADRIRVVAMAFRKPMHSAFYMTPLEVLLQHLQVETLILTGLTSSSCITVTAHDANMRGFDIYIPPDCSCGRSVEEHTQALMQLKATAGVSLTSSSSLKLPNVIRAAQISTSRDRRR